jgi:branched-chain amino acid transport system substrate-binding protein
MKKTHILAGLLPLAFAAAHADAQTIKVGSILTLSGPDATGGIQIDRGIKLYVKLHEKDLPAGMKVEVLTRDDTGPNPDVAKRLATELITRDKIQFLTGVVYTPNAVAIAPIITEAKIPFVIANAATASIPRTSPYIIRVSFTLWQTGLPLGKWAAAQGAKTGFTAVADYAPGFDAEGAFIKGFTEGGGTMKGTIRMPLGNLNFVPYLQRMVDEKPQVADIFVPVGVAVPLMRAVQSLNFAANGIRLVAPMDLVPDEQLPDMGDVVEGLVTSGTYSAVGKRPANQAFVAAWKKEYGPNALPDFTGVQGWDAMAAIYTVLEETKGKYDIDRAMTILANWKNPNSPRGPMEIDPKTRDVVENIYMRKVEKVDGKLSNVEFETIPMVKDPWKEMNPPK